MIDRTGLGIMIKWTPGITIDIAEQSCIEQAMQFYNGNKTATAQALGIAIRTLDAKLEKYDKQASDRVDFRERDRQHRENISARMRGQKLPYPDAKNPHERPDAKPLKDYRLKEGEIEERAAYFHGQSPHTGVDIQPVTQNKPQPQMPLPKRQEVQDVLPRQAAAGNKPKSR